MRLILTLVMAGGVAAAQQKCDAKKLQSLERRLDALTPSEVATRLLDACWPELNDVQGSPEMLLLAARDAYAHGRYAQAILLGLRVTRTGRPAAHETLFHEWFVRQGWSVLGEEGELQHNPFWLVMGTRAAYDDLLQQGLEAPRARRIARALLTLK